MRARDRARLDRLLSAGWAVAFDELGHCGIGSVTAPSGSVYGDRLYFGEGDDGYGNTFSDEALLRESAVARRLLTLLFGYCREGGDAQQIAAGQRR